jgi:conjugal transfer/entry exclusion protein
MLLRQIAAQRAKLDALNDGAQTLAKDIQVLDETLGEEQDSRDAILQDASRAIDGWGLTWAAYSKCEPVQVLQERPNFLASLIQGMSWDDKKEL